MRWTYITKKAIYGFKTSDWTYIVSIAFCKCNGLSGIFGYLQELILRQLSLP